MNRRAFNVLATLGLGSAGLSCKVEQEPLTEPLAMAEEQECSKHGPVSTLRKIQLPFMVGEFNLTTPELFRAPKSGWICGFCVWSEHSDISSGRLTAKAGRGRV